MQADMTATLGNDPINKPVIVQAPLKYTFWLGALAIGVLAVAIIGGIGEAGLNNSGTHAINSIGNEGLWAMRLTGYIGGGVLIIVGILGILHTRKQNKIINDNALTQVKTLETARLQSIYKWEKPSEDDLKHAPDLKPRDLNAKRTGIVYSNSQKILFFMPRENVRVCIRNIANIDDAVLLMNDDNDNDPSLIIPIPEHLLKS